MTVDQTLVALKKMGTPGIKNIFLKHGAVEPVYGVKISDLKTIQKKIKDNVQEVALQLYDSGVGEAMYLAGLLADGGKMNKKQLQAWVKAAEWPMISDFTVAWVTIENEAAWELATKWIDSPRTNIASAGWATLGSLVAVWPDEKISMAELKTLLKRVEKQIDKVPDRVKKSMNNFLIAVGSFIKELNQEAINTSKRIGELEIISEGTACKIPFAPTYIKKIMDKGKLGKKKKTAKC